MILQLLVRTRPNCIWLSPAGAISACRCYQVDFTTKHSKFSRRVLVSTGFVRYAYKSDLFVVHLDAICCKLKDQAQRGALWKVVDFSDQGQALFPQAYQKAFLCQFTSITSSRSSRSYSSQNNFDVPLPSSEVLHRMRG